MRRDRIEWDCVRHQSSRPAAAALLGYVPPRYIDVQSRLSSMPRLQESLFRLALASGLARTIRDSSWRRERLLILAYHGVSVDDEHEWDPALYLTQARLRQRFAQLRRGRYNVLPLGRALELLYAGELPDRSVAVTFDDGARDFARRALPVLQEFDVPVTVYLTTYYCDTNMPVFNTALSYLLWKARDRPADLRSAFPGGTVASLSTEAERMGVWRMIQDFSTGLRFDSRQKHKLLETVAEALLIDFRAFLASGILQLMSADEVRSLPPELVDVQLHTHRHRTPRDQAAFTREIVDNRDRIREVIGAADRRHFCYPSGDYSASFLPWLRKLDIESATTCAPGLAARASNPLLLPRLIDTMTVSDAKFEAWTSGVAQFVPTRRTHRIDPSRA